MQPPTALQPEGGARAPLLNPNPNRVPSPGVWGPDSRPLGAALYAVLVEAARGHYEILIPWYIFPSVGRTTYGTLSNRGLYRTHAL